MAVFKGLHARTLSNTVLNYFLPESLPIIYTPSVISSSALHSLHSQSLSVLPTNNSFEFSLFTVSFTQTFNNTCS